MKFTDFAICPLPNFRKISCLQSLKSAKLTCGSGIEKGLHAHNDRFFHVKSSAPEMNIEDRDTGPLRASR